MWYVIQTITGKEQELVDTIKQVMTYERKKYQHCFVIYQECAYRTHGVLEFHIEPLFPSYVFAETDTPEEFFLELKRVPRMSKLLGAEGCFWSIHKEEEIFLCDMLEESRQEDVREDRERLTETERLWKPEKVVIDGQLETGKVLKSVSQKSEKSLVPELSYLIRPSLVHIDGDGQIIKAEGILSKYIDKIVKQRLRKRSVIIEIPFCGKKRRIRLGIRLEGDDVEL